MHAFMHVHIYSLETEERKYITHVHNIKCIQWMVISWRKHKRFFLSPQGSWTELCQIDYFLRTYAHIYCIQLEAHQPFFSIALHTYTNLSNKVSRSSAIWVRLWTLYSLRHLVIFQCAISIFCCRTPINQKN